MIRNPRRTVLPLLGSYDNTTFANIAPIVGVHAAFIPRSCLTNKGLPITPRRSRGQNHPARHARGVLLSQGD